MAGSDEQMLAALGRALASVGHELNNVVGVVQSYAAFIQEGSRDDAVKADAQVIRSSVEKAAQLARQLLAFGHPRESETEPLELGAFAHDVAGFVRRMLGDAREVVVLPAEVPAVALVRRVELGRVLLAACLGLHGAALPNEPLVIRTVLVQGAPVLELGFDRELELDLDLEWAKRVMASQGATLRREGARAVLTFPAASEAALEVAMPAEAGAAEARGTETVLVVEESAELRQALCRMLEAAGYRALEAEDDAIALKLGLEGGLALDLLLSTSAAEELYRRLRVAHPQLCQIVRPQPVAAAELQRAARAALDERIGRSHAALVDAERVLALVVDDDPHVRLALSRILDDCGADVITAPSGLHALQKLASFPVDLLIADQAMPGMEGTRLLESAYKSWPRVARVVYSGYLSSGLVVDAVNRANVHKILAKDMSPELLRQQLSELIAEIRSQRS